MADADGQAKIWLVVKPEVGLMWLIGGAALAAVVVHAFVLGHSKWFPAFMEGGKAKVSIEHVIPYA